MSAVPESPRVVGDYTLLAPLGEGGMGVVHLARHRDGSRVALKVLRPQVVGDQEARQRLAREVGSLRRVRNRWVAEIVDADPFGPVPFVATRYVPGLSLHDVIAQEGPVEGADLWWLARCLAEGIAAVHGAGVLHRDVKPSNVLMEGRTPVLIDFGLARVADDPKLTQTGWLLGTPGYLAPEVLYGEEPTAAVDVHAWAATIAFAATGNPPFGRGPGMAVMDRTRRGQFDLTGVPGELLPVLTAALDPEPARRPTLDSIIAWLRGTSDSPTVAAPRAPRRVPEEHHTKLLPELEQVEQAGPPSSRSLRGERARRIALVLLLGVACAAALSSYPWLGLGVLLVLVWLLRGASMAGSGHLERRQLRGRKWHDAPRLVLTAPWVVVRAVPTTLLLALWAMGLAVAAALVCYAIAAPVELGLALSGFVLVAALWWGPGGSRVRGPVGRLVRPLSRRTGVWLVAVLVLIGLSGLFAGLAGHGTDWRPAGGPPLGNVFR